MNFWCSTYPGYILIFFSLVHFLFLKMSRLAHIKCTDWGRPCFLLFAKHKLYNATVDWWFSNSTTTLVCRCRWMATSMKSNRWIEVLRIHDVKPGQSQKHKYMGGRGGESEKFWYLWGVNFEIWKEIVPFLLHINVIKIWTVSWEINCFPCSVYFVKVLSL